MYLKLSQRYVYNSCCSVYVQFCLEVSYCRVKTQVRVYRLFNWFKIICNQVQDQAQCYAQYVKVPH